MSINNQESNQTNRSWLPVVLALILGFFAAHVEYHPQTVQAEIRKTQKRTAFQSGSERSETLLRDISGTLKKIDARLQRIERSVGKK